MAAVMVMPVESASESHISMFLQASQTREEVAVLRNCLEQFAGLQWRSALALFKKKPITFLRKRLALLKEQTQHRADYSLSTRRTMQVLDQRWQMTQQRTLIPRFATNQHYYAENQHTITGELQKMSTVLTSPPHTVGLHTAMKVRQFDLLSKKLRQLFRGT